MHDLKKIIFLIVPSTKHVDKQIKQENTYDTNRSNKTKNQFFKYVVSYKT
jgi:hypothetical protein